MKSATLTLSLIAATLAACSSESEPSNAVANNTTEAIPPANTAQAQMSDDTRLTRLAECSVAMESVANTYETLARSRDDAELRALAADRDAAAVAYRQQAEELAQRMGRQPDEVGRMVEAAMEQVRLEAQSTQGDDAAFQAFLTGQGADADACVRELGAPAY